MGTKKRKTPASTVEAEPAIAAAAAPDAGPTKQKQKKKKQDASKRQEDVPAKQQVKPTLRAVEGERRADPAGSAQRKAVVDVNNKSSKASGDGGVRERGENDEAAGAAAAAAATTPPLAITPREAPSANPSAADSFKNKEKILVLSSRGITFRFRHLMEDAIQLLPHAKKDSKLDNRDKRVALNELADLKDCTSILFFECRKKKDLYTWISKTPNGPTAKFYTTAAVMPMPCVFLVQERVVDMWKREVFTTPKDHRKVKPFFDHVFSFTVLDNHIWFRNYQICAPILHNGKLERGALEKMTLVEVGPRFTWSPVKIFSGSFSGSTLYENPDYVSPNMLRRLAKQRSKGRYMDKVIAKEKRKLHVSENPAPPRELADVWAE
ncbi:hypothetical protein CBR_g29800 [Chara braunii]|uniref:Brix domain-containing protein n=1 Tax=Chara braunii TaxID=69332 RepID=A0A388LBU3_CHABU|nr:hypothetical protein CBR_g29800 [Chara braunii]|eukprot:GBG79652.1 hypothetical protein CBR_g29800 [Chara braunii]